MINNRQQNALDLKPLTQKKPTQGISPYPSQISFRFCAGIPCDLGIHALVVTILLGLVLTGCGKHPDESQSGPPARELSWDDLMPADWQPEKLFEDINIDEIADEDPQASDLMQKLAILWKEAPIVPELNGLRVRLPGFVVPIDLQAERIEQFLLVPYFGACIHVPPPPANQTVYVTTHEGKPYAGGLFDTVWVEGEMQVDTIDSALGSAGYRIEQARVTPYEIND